MNKIYNGIMGLTVGDALGVPFEFKQRDTFECTEMIGYGTHRQPSGTWSDDTSLTLATMSSIVDKGRIDLEYMMSNFYYWLYHGEFTPYGAVFDAGNTTIKAIDNFAKRNCDEFNCGCDSIGSNGNGSLMRILPLAFMSVSRTEIDQVSALTHAHEISQNCCAIYVYIAKALLRGATINEVIPKLKINGGNCISELQRDDLSSSGYVVTTLESALWCLLNTDNYKDCVLTAVNLGGDTDTIAAVAGGLAGIVYGIGGKKGIPTKWIKRIARRKDIKKLCDRFERVISKHDDK